MKPLSLFKYVSSACGFVAAAALISSCGSSTISPEKALQRLSQSPSISVFSHNDVNSPRLRDCYEAGPMPDRAQRALTTWLANSEVKEFSYVYPQYYITTTNAQGGGEVVWALCSDGKGNLTGVLAPANKRIPAWDLPTIGSYKLYVCNTDEKEALSNAIMESLADAGYDQARIDSRKAKGITDKQHLISKPLDEEKERLIRQEKEARAKAIAEQKSKLQEKSSKSDEEDTSSEDSEDDDVSSGDGTSDDSSSDDEDSSSSGDESSSSSDDDDSGSSDEDSSSDSIEF